MTHSHYRGKVFGRAGNLTPSVRTSATSLYYFIMYFVKLVVNVVIESIFDLLIGS